ncbi:MAG: prepilin peptidase [Mailhella sp.]|nr:prepilin peptidase [Mailhella sp.]
MKELIILFPISLILSAASAAFLSCWEKRFRSKEAESGSRPERDQRAATFGLSPPFTAALCCLLLLTALSVIFCFSARDFDLSETISRLFLTALLWTAAHTDRRKRLIPNRLIFAALLFRLLLYLWALLSQKITAEAVLQHAAFSLLIPLVCLAVSCLIPEGLGMGDVKLMFVIAFSLPFWEGVSALLFSFLSAGISSLFQAFMGKKSSWRQLPLAPFFLVGTLFSFLLHLQE